MASITTSNEIVVPRSVRRKAGIKPGERVEFKVSGRTITIAPTVPTPDDEYTPAERRAIDRGIAQSEKEYREGKHAGPFDTADEFLADLHRESAKLDAKKTRQEMKLDRTPYFLRAYHKPPRHKQKALTSRWFSYSEISTIHRFTPRSTTKPGTMAGPLKGWRFYFKIIDDTYLLEEIRRHPKK